MYIGTNDKKNGGDSCRGRSAASPTYTHTHRHTHKHTHII